MLENNLTGIARAAGPAGPAVAVELFGHQERLRDDRSVGAGARAVGVHGPAFPAVGARLGGARIQHHVAVGAAKSLGARTRVPVRRRALARPSVKARFVCSAVVKI